MKPLLLSIPAFLAAGCLAAAPVSGRTVPTVAGELKILEKNASGQCVVLLAGKAVHKLDCQFSYPPNLLGHFKGSFGSFQEVVVWQESPMGNACNGGPLHFLGIRGGGGYELSPPLDFCGGADPVLKQEAGRIVVTLPGGAPNRGPGTIPTRVWVYENGKLTKTKELAVSP